MSGTVGLLERDISFEGNAFYAIRCNVGSKISEHLFRQCSCRDDSTAADHSWVTVLSMVEKVRAYWLKAFQKGTFSIRGLKWGGSGRDI